MKIGKKSRIYRKVVIVNPWNIVVGDNSVINERCHIDGRGGLNIGSNCSISSYCKIITATHSKEDANFTYIKNGVTIADFVWIGTAGIILDGSVINSRTIIGAGAVFKGVSEPDSVYIGSPAFLKCKRNLKDEYTLNTKNYLL